MVVDAASYYGGQARDAFISSSVGSLNGLGKTLSFGLYSRTAEDIGWYGNFADGYDVGTLIFSSAPNPFGLGGTMGPTPSLASSGGVQISLTTTRDLAVKATATAFATGNAQAAAKPVQEYEVGEYGDLQKRSEAGDGLDLHHVPQKHPAAQVIPGYDKLKGTAIALRQEIHRMIPTIRGTYDGTARDLLATDAKNLRQIGVGNNFVQQIIYGAKVQHPEAYVKPPKTN
jgi:hypothetical protein